MSGVNIPLLRKAVEWVESSDEWSQHAWFERTGCGTTRCVAGFIAEHEGWTPLWYGGLTTGSVTRGGLVRTAAYVAAKALGVTDADSEVLFHFLNTAADVRLVAEQLAGERL